MSRVAVLFIDGVGVGPRDPDRNPLARGEYLLSQFADGTGTPLPASGQRHDVDTTFGVAGRPQSASNQTAILTGTPAPARQGQHTLGFPNATLRKYLLTESIARKLETDGKRVAFANGFPSVFLELLKLPRRSSKEPALEVPAQWARRARASAFQLALASEDAPLRTFGDVNDDAAITNDITGESAARRFSWLKTRTPEEAAQVFWGLGADVTFFEHSLADEAGHARSWEAAEHSLSRFDRFAREVLKRAPRDAEVIICSDHGNVEDLSTRNHTRNPVSVLTFGHTHLAPMQRLDGVGLRILQASEAK